MKLRIFLLRILIASWMIPVSWVIMWPLFALMSGVKEGTDGVIDFNRSLWNGA